MTKAYIYKIENKVNNKIYIGQTSRTIEERYSEHLRCAFIRGYKQPLYNAMRKYGKEAFKISLVEECDANDVNNREIYYIDKYDTYKNGYNATLGGEGKLTNNYQELVEDFFKSGLSITKYSEEKHIKDLTVRNALNAVNRMEEYRRKYTEYNTRYNSVSVKMLDKKTKEVLNVFESINQAMNFLNAGGDKGHIKAVCNGKRNSAYGYKWQFA